MLSTKLLETRVAHKALKYNFLISGIAGFTITFAQFDDHCDQ
jgi:hypothetical protein